MYAYAKRQKPENRINQTGIPDRMRQGFEKMSGLSFEDVRVHYHSAKPAQRMAYAYAQGNQVYLASGQEKYLGHELGHVLEWKQGRVKTEFYRNGEAVNDSVSLELEADLLAAAAERMSALPAPTETGMGQGAAVRQDAPIQRTKWRYRQDTNGWDVEEEGETLSPAPPLAESELLISDADMGVGPLRDGCVDTASYEYLCWLAKKRWRSYGGFINHTLHSPGTTNELGQRTVGNRLYEMYRDTRGARNPREYMEAEDIHRFLRWFATFLSVKYEITGEIQCYYDRSSRQILVSTNLSGEISRLGKRLGNVGTDYEAGKTNRQKRHMRHMYRIHRNLVQSGHAFGEISIRIVGDIGIENAHAEQRILNFLRQEPMERQAAMLEAGALVPDGGELWLDPKYLGGIRRCCFACAHACIAPAYRDAIHPGAFWDTRASGVYMDGESIVSAVEGIRAEAGTHVTIQGNRATTECDTDSEAEEAGAECAWEEEEEAGAEYAWEEETAADELDTALVSDIGNYLYQRIMDAFFR